jgi:hypothetical protein
LREAVEFYSQTSQKAREHNIRNGDPNLSNVHLRAEDVGPLVKFLSALNEDYE